MASLLLLPLLSFVVAHNDKLDKKEAAFVADADIYASIENDQPKQPSVLRRALEVKSIKALNGTELIMECAPAEYLVRTHMAPDFENPQLVRKLDWFHDDSLIASFQQDVVTGISEEWWVASTRYELRRPFYQLRVAPVLASDSGKYKCWLETDPFFTLDQPSSIMDLLVMVKPFPPSKPQVSGADSEYAQINEEVDIISNTGAGIVLISWNHSVGVAHRPILHYSIMISQVNNSANIRVITTENNRTSKLVDGLIPNTQYAFSVRAENSAGDSEFGAETLFKTASPVPKFAPKITAIENRSKDNDGSACVEVEWRLGFEDSKHDQISHKSIVGYKITVTEIISGQTDLSDKIKSTSELNSHQKSSHRSREWHVKKGTQKSVLLCSLEYGTEFRLSIEADTGFGLSPPAITIFRTAEFAPNGPPEQIVVQLLPPDIATVSWHEPEHTNGQILSYQIYVREKTFQTLERSSPLPTQPPTLIRLLVEPNEKSKVFAYNITKLVPNSIYEIRLSASTNAGESNKSNALFVRTDRAPPTPKIKRIGYECLGSNGGENSVSIQWNNVIKDGEKSNQAPSTFYRVQFEDAHRKFILNSTVNSITIDNLEAEERYYVRISSAIQSQTDKSVFFYSPYSKTEIFKIDKSKCQFYSSICLPENRNCKAIVSSKHIAQANETISLSLLCFGVVSTILLSIIFTCFLKRNCSFFKSVLKKRKTDGNPKIDKNELYQREIVSRLQEPLMDDFEMEYGQTITVNEFDDYYEQMSANKNAGFQRQFQELDNDTNPLNNGTGSSIPENENEYSDAYALKNNNNHSNKNRYINVYALEHSRIRIRRSSGCSNRNSSESCNPMGTLSAVSTRSPDYDNEYINANYVDSCEEKNAYIATQAPLPHTFTDFWTMIWQENCSLIVMITNFVENGRRKCDQYWPSTVNTSMHFGNDSADHEAGNVNEFEVTLNMEHTNSVFTHRIFTLRLLQTQSAAPSLASSMIGTLQKSASPHLNQKCRIVHHLQFTSWPDHGVPSTVTPLLHFINYAENCYNTYAIGGTINRSCSARLGPVVVHCSAGVGRSGAFILIDSMRRHLQRCDRINIQAHLRRIRGQRSRSVQTLEQYIFCHQVLRQLIRHGNTYQSVNTFPNYLHFLFNQHFESGNETFGTPAITRIKAKIQLQFEDFCKCPHEINCQRNTNKSNICISLPGYHKCDEFLVGRWPTECAELWSTIWRQRCPLVVLLGADAEVGDFFKATAIAPQNTLIWAYSNESLMETRDNSKQGITPVTLRRQMDGMCNEIPISNNNKVNMVFDSGFSELDNNDALEDCLSLSLSQTMTTSIRQQLISKDNLVSPTALTSILVPEQSLQNEYQTIRLCKDESTIDVRIIRVQSAPVESNIWLEIERIQDHLLQCEPLPKSNQHQSIMILDPRSVNNSIPFILCALQWTACQLETEGFVDVPLYLDAYRRIACGCWTAQSNIEYIYAKILELIQLKRSQPV